MGYWEKDEYGNWFFCGGQVDGEGKPQERELECEKVQIDWRS